MDTQPRPASIGVPAGTAGADMGDEGPSIIQRTLVVLKGEPVLFVTAGYLAISVIGLWSSWWFYRQLGLPILGYLQAADFVVAGLREPVYVVALALTIGTAWLVTWPERWRRKNPQAARKLEMRWWGRLVLPPRRGWYSWWGMQPDTALVFCVAVGMLSVVAGLSVGHARALQRGRGAPVEVTLAGSITPLEGDVRMLGTSASFAFLYWPKERRIEAVVLESVARIRAVPRAADQMLLPAGPR